MVELDQVRELMQRVMGNEKKKRNTVLWITLAAIFAAAMIGLSIYMILQRRREYYDDAYYDDEYYDDYDEYEPSGTRDEDYEEYEETEESSEIEQEFDKPKEEKKTE